jgi:hypothetical protein
VRGVKGKKRKPKTEPDNEAQSARFIKAAKALGTGESGDAFEVAFKAIAKETRLIGPIRASGKDARHKVVSRRVMLRPYAKVGT